MTACDRFRERLPEHVLGTVEGDDDLAIRRHLRGCASCRAEMDALGEGLTLFARAAHDRTPPPDLQDRVRAVLQEEWRDAPAPVDAKRRSWVLAGVAATLVVLLSVGFGLLQAHRAGVVAEDAQSYSRLLELLGGKGFRVGQLEPSGARPLEGTVVVYDSHVEQSWVVVFIRTSGVTGDATATLSSRDGRTIDTWPVSIDLDGGGYGWLVTSLDLEPFDSVTLYGPQGETLASGTITPA